jgi:c-di-GMP-specific phosphodiesterase
MTDAADQALAAEIDAALTAGEFEPVFQPIARLADGALAGFEALARWRRSDGTLWGPDRFLRVALKHDLVGAISERILAAATHHYSRWRQSSTAAHGLFLTINIPGSQLERGDAVSLAVAASKAGQLPPGSLKLEITEHQILRDPKAAAAACAKLKEQGVGVALDDFGAGFASLTWLMNLPADTLKIDQSLVQGVGKQAKAERIVRAVIALAHELGLDVVAEGVEHAETREALGDMGCDYAQGHLFAPALSAGGAEALILTLASADPLVSLS